VKIYRKKICTKHFSYLQIVWVCVVQFRALWHEEWLFTIRTPPHSLSSFCFSNRIFRFLWKNVTLIVCAHCWLCALLFFPPKVVQQNVARWQHTVKGHSVNASMWPKHNFKPLGLEYIHETIGLHNVKKKSCVWGSYKRWRLFTFFSLAPYQCVNCWTGFCLYE
jgi:hypothetical protein